MGVNARTGVGSYEVDRFSDTWGAHESHIFPMALSIPRCRGDRGIKGVTRIIDIEQNGTGQLASLMREQAGIEITEKILKYDGRPFYPEELLEKLEGRKS